MNIGLVPTLNPSFGGSYQYALAILDAAINLSRMKHDDDSYVLFTRPDDHQVLRTVDPLRGIQIVQYGSQSDRLLALGKSWAGQGMIRKALITLRQQAMGKRVQKSLQRRRSVELGKCLRHHNIDWVLYTAPDLSALETGIPFVMPVFDLQHRLQPEFPEVSSDGEWDELERLYRNGTCQATLILADSEVGKEDILACYGAYGVTADRIKVLPYVPAPYLSSNVPLSERAKARTTYALPDRYLFYPAQLWPHKNHVRIVQALGRLKEENGLAVQIVFCGASSGAIRTQVLKEILHEADRWRIVPQIHYLGYVPNDAMSALYAEATGLVMPTFFGPTNIPIVEAWLLGCPVLTSDIRGIREQVGDAGILVDPKSVEAIADGIHRLWENAALRADLAQRGRQRLALYGRQDLYPKLAEIIAETNLRVGHQRQGVGK
jgi:glycosyltransferase involved in cell wall biosynthesis